MMADEDNSCKKCTEYEVILSKKNFEIKKLKVQIKNLKTFFRDYENRAKLCQFCSITKLKGDTRKEIDDSQAETCNEEGFEADTDIHYSQKPENNLILRNNEDLHCRNTLESDSICGGDDHKISNDNLSSVNASTDENSHKTVSENKNSADYVYDENLNMYYCPSTGYYYDHKSSLFYLPQTCAYYSYNYVKGEYEVCETLASKEILNKDCDSVLEKVSCLHINDNDLGSAAVTSNSEKLRNSFQQGDSLYEKYETLEDNMLDGSSKDWEPIEGSNTTVKDLVRNAAEENSGMSDYVYDEKSAMYYCKSTGHFYDPVKKLLYDPHTKVYYLYIEETASYEFYCKADEAATMSLLPKNDRLKRNYKKKSKKQWQKKLYSSDKADELLNKNTPEVDKDHADKVEDSLEEGEIVSTTDSDSESEPSRESTPPINPPCIRAIVKKSAKLKKGSLILITCTGAIIGREKTNTVCVPEVGVSKTHAEIKFNNDSWKYSIEDLGSQNGTFVNDVKLSEPKDKSKALSLNHGDIVKLGTCELLLHIHEGYFTCDKCEPGQVLAEISAQETKPVAVLKTKEEKEKERREEMSKLKKKYGLKGIEYTSVKKPFQSGSKYEDKAEMRRRTVGSQNPYEKTEAASMEEGISKSNKGFQMLKKLGWKEGDSLGLKGSGISEPIPLRPWLSKAGLGSSEFQAITPTTATSTTDKRRQRWVKAQERYFQLS